VLFLNKKNMLIADEAQQRGTVDHTLVYPREVVKRALELGATEQPPSSTTTLQVIRRRRAMTSK